MRVFKGLRVTMLIAAVVLIGVGCNGNGNSQAGDDAAAVGGGGSALKVGASVGKLAPDFTLPDIFGNSVSLADHRGDVVIVDWWATWCGPCRMVMPHLEAIHREYGDKGVTIIAIATDRNMEKVVPPYIEKAGYTFKVLYYTEESRQDYGGIRSLPTTFVIDPEGVITGRVVGAHPKSFYIEQINKAKPGLI